ncbi:MAG: patatin-like phospholipase family protein, partial [Acetobacteraceae bacterium]
MAGVKQTRLEALARELAAVREQQGPIASEAELHALAHRLDLSALCLSGGGIRSAAFCLGVLQALARANVLAKFDYLSTVSGGGYIGSWLQGMVHHRGSPEAAQAALADPITPPQELVGLRNYTSYLAPRGGLFSTDSWTDLVLYLRNVLLNWAVYLPLLALPLLLTIFYRTAVAVVAYDAQVQLG